MEPKPFKSVDDQIAILQDRGMEICDDEFARRALREIGYYRLSGYSYPYRAVQAETGLLSDNFIDGTTIEKVVKLYRYDQELRAVTGLQLAKIEIVLRVMISHELGRVDPYIHLSPHKLGKKAWDKVNVRPTEQYSEWLDKYSLSVVRSNEGGVIGCKQFSCSGDAVWRLIMGCRRMLGVEDRAAIMAGVNAGLSKTRIAHLIGRSPSVVCREIARHTGPDGEYRAEEADKAARAARRRPKKRLLDCDEVLRDRVIADLSQGHTPRQISGRLREEACGTLPSMDTSPDAQGHTISHEAIYTWIYAHPKKTLIEHGICLPSRRWMRKKPPTGGRKPPIVGMRLIDERPDISDRKIPGNWEGDLIIGQDGASACATLVERTTRYLIIVALPLGRKADQVCDALTRRIQGLPDGAMRTLTWDQGREMARHQRLTHDTGVEVFFAHPHSPWERGTNENTNRLIRRYLPKGTPITSHQPYLDAIAYELNNCPRATLGYRTPTEAFNELIATTH